MRIPQKHAPDADPGWEPVLRQEYALLKISRRIGALLNKSAYRAGKIRKRMISARNTPFI
jgi:hypothetical protein